MADFCFKIVIFFKSMKSMKNHFLKNNRKNYSILLIKSYKNIFDEKFAFSSKIFIICVSFLGDDIGFDSRTSQVVCAYSGLLASLSKGNI